MRGLRARDEHRPTKQFVRDRLVRLAGDADPCLLTVDELARLHRLYAEGCVEAGTLALFVRDAVMRRVIQVPVRRDYRRERATQQCA